MKYTVIEIEERGGRRMMVIHDDDSRRFFAGEGVSVCGRSA
jgi:hypothetical protein